MADAIFSWSNLWGDRENLRKTHFLLLLLPLKIKCFYGSNYVHSMSIIRVELSFCFFWYRIQGLFFIFGFGFSTLHFWLCKNWQLQISVCFTFVLFVFCTFFVWFYYFLANRSRWVWLYITSKSSFFHLDIFLSTQALLRGGCF
jgi:hypothetical protein